MDWYLLHTKPRQEKCALLNLQQQGYECYLPIFPSEKLFRRTVSVVDVPLFPRYLFIRLGKGDSAKSWSPIRSTKGVSRLVTFGSEPAKVDEDIVRILRQGEQAPQTQAQRLFARGERVVLTEGAFAGIEGIYQMADGDSRVVVLIELLSKTVRVKVSPAALYKLN